MYVDIENTLLLLLSVLYTKCALETHLTRGNQAYE